MNDQQRTVCAIGVVVILLGAIFFVPWRVESSGEIEWGPVYRQPVTYSQTYATERPGARYAYDDAHIHIGYLLFELLAIGAVCAAGYVLAAGAREESDE